LRCRAKLASRRGAKRLLDEIEGQIPTS